MENKFNGKLQFNHVLITLDTIGSDSGIIIEGTNTKKKLLKYTQKVVAAGPNATSMKKGDTVYVDTDRLTATQASGKSVHLRQILVDKTTGDLLTDDNKDKVKDENIVSYGLITDREILIVMD